MYRQNILENLSSWIRAISGAIGVLILCGYVMWNNENEKSSTLTQETKINEMRIAENLSPDEEEPRKNQVEMKSSTLTQDTKINENRNVENFTLNEAETIKNRISTIKLE